MANLLSSITIVLSDLRAAGYTVETADVPGLTEVFGPSGERVGELTLMQLVELRDRVREVKRG